MASSAQLRDIILDKINSAESILSAASDGEGFKRANEYLHVAMQGMKGGFAAMSVIDGLLDNSSRLNAQDRDLCWQKWKSAKDSIGLRREYVQNLNAGIADRFVSRVWDRVESDNPYDGLEALKYAQREIKKLYLHKDKRGKVRESFDRAYERISTRIALRKNEIRKRQFEFLTRLVDARERKVGALHRAMDNVESNRIRRAAAWSDDYRQRFDTWIEEGLSRVRDLQRSITDIDQKISEVERKLKS